jgi:hypothetical protein
MNKEEAINVLAQALDMAAKSGVYNLNDTSIIVQAINKISELVEIVPTEE